MHLMQFNALMHKWKIDLVSFPTLNRKDDAICNSNSYPGQTQHVHVPFYNMELHVVIWYMDMI